MTAPVLAASGSTFLFTSYMNAQAPAGSGAGVYPIINYEYAVVSISQASPTRAQDLRAFLNWAISTGTAQLAQVNFQPPPPSVVTLSRAQVAKIKG